MSSQPLWSLLTVLKSLVLQLFSYDWFLIFDWFLIDWLLKWETVLRVIKTCTLLKIEHLKPMHVSEHFMHESHFFLVTCMERYHRAWIMISLCPENKNVRQPCTFLKKWVLTIHRTCVRHAWTFEAQHGTCMKSSYITASWKQLFCVNKENLKFWESTFSSK